MVNPKNKLLPRPWSAEDKIVVIKDPGRRIGVGELGERWGAGGGWRRIRGVGLVGWGGWLGGCSLSKLWCKRRWCWLNECGKVPKGHPPKA